MGKGKFTVGRGKWEENRDSCSETRGGEEVDSRQLKVERDEENAFAGGRTAPLEGWFSTEGS